MPTALRGIGKLGPINSQTDVVVQGAGPVGLAVTFLVSLAGARTITVIGDPAHRLEIARSLGATQTLSISESGVEKRHEKIKAFTNGRGASMVIEASGSKAAFPEGFNLLGMNGKYLILGLYSGKAEAVIDPVRINNYNLHIIGSLGIETENYLKTVELATVHGKLRDMDRLITHRFPLSSIEDAIQSVAQGIPAKAVIVP
ncbi:hypothetical protein CLAIMM_00101 [Cladophialophora immunda]|nr:hypothetical protein CLAIMM_00101 [Cladophialophora immunda]